MKKTTVYLETEDDITAIIEKVKAAKNAVSINVRSEIIKTP